MARREAHIALNAPVLLFTPAVPVASAMLSGLAPALDLSGCDLVTALKESGRGASGGVRQRFARSVLVVGEVALWLPLVGASLMIRALLSLERTNLEFRPHRIPTLRLPFTDQRYPGAGRRTAFLVDLLDRVGNVADVAAVGVNTGLPPVGMPVEVPGVARQDMRPVLIDQGIPTIEGPRCKRSTQCSRYGHLDDEIGIRLALGASFWMVIRMVLSLGAKLVAVGILLGLAGSLASVRVLSGLVRDMSTFDPYPFLAVRLLLFLAWLCASFWPARRAARVDPVTALRDE
jgi:hypothetical protein